MPVPRVGAGFEARWPIGATGRGPRPPTRRAFLAGVALAGTSWVAPGCSPWFEVGLDRGLWYALLADTHIAADPDTALRGQTMARNLKTVVAEILDARQPPGGVVVAGDLAFVDGQLGDYHTFRETTEPLRQAGLPLHLALGNHDDRETFRRVLADTATLSHAAATAKHVGVVEGSEGSEVRLVLLDSLQRPNVTAGLLGDLQRAWLAQILDARPWTPTLLVVHHHLDAEARPALNDTEALLQLIRPRRQVKAVIFGHTHAWDIREADGLHLINLPAVAYTFAPRQPLGWCRLRPRTGGADLELRTLTADRRSLQRRFRLSWRT